MQARVLEPLVVLSFAYISYLTAEIFHMSGILAITFCGITMKNYVGPAPASTHAPLLLPSCSYSYPPASAPTIVLPQVEKNISASSSTTIRSSAHMIANCAEMMIFLFLGVFTLQVAAGAGEGAGAG